MASQSVAMAAPERSRFAATWRSTAAHAGLVPLQVHHDSVVLPAAHPGNLFDAVRARRMRRVCNHHLGAEVPGHGFDAHIIGGDNHAFSPRCAAPAPGLDYHGRIPEGCQGLPR